MQRLEMCKVCVGEGCGSSMGADLHVPIAKIFICKIPVNNVAVAPGVPLTGVIWW